MRYSYSFCYIKEASHGGKQVQCVPVMCTSHTTCIVVLSYCLEISVYNHTTYVCRSRADPS